MHSNRNIAIKHHGIPKIGKIFTRKVLQEYSKLYKTLKEFQKNESFMHKNPSSKTVE